MSIAAPTITSSIIPKRPAITEPATATVYDMTMPVSLRELATHIAGAAERASLCPPPTLTETAVVSARVHRHRGSTEARGKYRFHPYLRPNHVRKPGRAAGCSVKPAVVVGASAFLGSPVFAPHGDNYGTAPVSEFYKIKAAL
ncbi:uncharacterized protein TRAVEDRAFT_41583 [Trametes versicolor FP-101664 SS1]|uniref:uncharacterized protein n=1 Tax=Trametes versicolor (strain FP-101664) TaxID=717944 RepID=UPI00046241E8|nr:uncharacterized protein TRAVEDRAFT_41583 [Trametes versicolor FP-101664 SS1]EIW64167.1 hypothetical protein TRAVEDRAFT_41583 [Trametes versicolor FP-101664 SS1]